MVRVGQADMMVLSGYRVLVVEDEAIVSMLIEAHLTEFGCLVAGPAGTVRDALELIERDPTIDAAVLDRNLAGDHVDPVAAALSAKGIPFLFLTGYGGQPVDAYPSAPVLGKPFQVKDLCRELSRLRAHGERLNP